MTPFEYVIVLVSIILGLGITTILTGVAELIKQTRPVGLYFPYVVWIILIFVLHIQDWWVSYELKTVQVWALHSFLLIILYPINLYILAHLLFPSNLSRDFSAREFYMENYPRLFIGAFALGVLSTVQNIVFSGLSFMSQAPKLVFFAILLVMVIVKSRNGLIHTALALILLIATIVGLALDEENLVIQ